MEEIDVFKINDDDESNMYLAIAININKQNLHMYTKVPQSLYSVCCHFRI